MSRFRANEITLEFSDGRATILTGKPSANCRLRCALEYKQQSLVAICRPRPETSAPFQIRTLYPGEELSSELMSCFKNQLLYAPIQQFGHVEFGLRWACDFVNPTELLELFARFSEHAQDPSIQG